MKRSCTGLIVIVGIILITLGLTQVSLKAQSSANCDSGIYFNGEYNNGSELLFICPDGSDLQPLLSTKDILEHHHVVYSDITFDGRQLLFSGVFPENSDHQNELFLYDLEDSSLIQVTDSVLYEEYGSFLSPDQTSVAYCSRSGNSNETGGVYIVANNHIDPIVEFAPWRENSRELAGYCQITWSTNGEEVYFIVYTSDVYNPDGVSFFSFTVLASSIDRTNSLRQVTPTGLSVESLGNIYEDYLYYAALATTSLTHGIYRVNPVTFENELVLELPDVNSNSTIWAVNVSPNGTIVLAVDGSDLELYVYSPEQDELSLLPVRPQRYGIVQWGSYPTYLVTE